MNTLFTRFFPAVCAALLFAPTLAFAQEEAINPALESAISFGYYISLLGFIVGTIITYMAVKKFGKSTLGSIFTYLLVGTATFLVITVFQTLGSDFFGISDDSMDVWWHLMFYLAFASYYIGLKALIGLGSAEQSAGSIRVGAEKMWAMFAGVILIAVFIIPSSVEYFILAYVNSAPGMLGLHHFLAFALSAAVGYYLLDAKKRIGQIGRAIATPMIIAIWAFAGQHLWELMFESWKWVDVTSEVGEGGERIFLTISAIGITYAAWRLKSFAR